MANSDADIDDTKYLQCPKCGEETNGPEDYISKTGRLLKTCKKCRDRVSQSLHKKYLPNTELINALYMIINKLDINDVNEAVKDDDTLKRALYQQNPKFILPEKD